jgi:hypothetical protein
MENANPPRLIGRVKAVHEGIEISEFHDAHIP